MGFRGSFWLLHVGPGYPLRLACMERRQSESLMRLDVLAWLFTVRLLPISPTVLVQSDNQKREVSLSDRPQSKV